MSVLQFARYRSAAIGQLSHLHQAKKLFQECIVDKYVRVKLCRQHQLDLCAEHYKGPQVFIIQRAQRNELDVGIFSCCFPLLKTICEICIKATNKLWQLFENPVNLAFFIMSSNPNSWEIIKALQESSVRSSVQDFGDCTYAVFCN